MSEINIIKFDISKAVEKLFETINSGQKPERNAEKTNEYATLEEAIQFFTKFVNITSLDKKKYFPLTQQELEFKNE